jgi:hypothetical protein
MESRVRGYAKKEEVFTSARVGSITMGEILAFASARLFMNALVLANARM